MYGCLGVGVLTHNSSFGGQRLKSLSHLIYLYTLIFFYQDLSLNPKLIILARLVIYQTPGPFCSFYPGEHDGNREEAHGHPTVGSVGLAVLSFSPYLTPASFWITFKSPETRCFMVSHHWKPVPAIQDAGFLLLLSRL